ncbi:hypothetical protein Goklo_012870, partial [Gossypium klotzschianum]|nr:hypothetical protein [Gossypium klotzschianum]
MEKDPITVSFHNIPVTMHWKGLWALFRISVDLARFKGRRQVWRKVSLEGIPKQQQVVNNDAGKENVKILKDSRMYLGENSMRNSNDLSKTE